MKMRILIGALFTSINICAVANSTTQTTDSLGLPGDNLNLYGVLDLFKKSESPEAFEKSLNSSETKLNNLDLNGDGEIDYIRVIDRSEKNMHALVLQIPINEDESQDVAVIEIDKNDDGTANIQIVGDEELYGKNYIIQPAEEGSKVSATTVAPVQSTQQTPSPSTERTSTIPPPPVIVNVVMWPAVRYVYQPVYSPWVSPWRWRYYPPYWKPWRPVMWSAYHPHWHPYHAHYHRGHTYNVVKVHDMYYSHRVVSRTVYQRRTGAQRSAPGSNAQQHRRAPGQHAAPGNQRRSQDGQRRARQQKAPAHGAGNHSGRRGGGKGNNAPGGSTRSRR